MVTKSINIPIVNIKLPLDMSGSSISQPISLARALNQTDIFVEHRSIVPKNKSVIYSEQVCFFYANRRYQSMSFTALDCNLAIRYMALPTPVMNTTKTNTTQIIFDDPMRIGSEWFEIRSVCLLQRPPLNGFDIPTGASAIIKHRDPNDPTQVTYWHYNPAFASIQFYDGQMNQYRANDPITVVLEYDPNPNNIGFRAESQERGTIYFYTKI